MKTKKIVGFGDVLDDVEHPESQTVKKGSRYYVYPIDVKGVERKWRFARQSVEDVKELLRVKKRKDRYEIEIGKDYGTYKTVWIDPRYDANEYGTKIVKRLVPESNFDFPKSLYNTYDCLYAVVSEKKEALILDFFAGSGTTGHAVMELNNEDGGNRRFILSTNNENDIATNVCNPRIKRVIEGYEDEKGKVKGLGGNLKYFRTSFVPAETTDHNKEKLTQKAVEMLCLRENTFESVNESEIIKIFKNNEKYTGILFDEFKIPEFKEQIKDFDKPVSIYIFSLGDDDYAEEFSNMRGKVKVCSIPAAILRVYKRIFK